MVKEKIPIKDVKCLLSEFLFRKPSYADALLQYIKGWNFVEFV